MSIPAAANAEPVQSRTQLVESVEQGSKPAADWRIGTEHEKFAFRWDDYRRLPYDGDCGIRALLEGLERFGWDPVREGETVIGLKRDGASVSLEPGGQLELSGAALETIHQTCDEVHTHLAEAETVTKELGAGLIGLGFDPKWRRADMPWMPKGRYRIMRDYMPKKGNLGLDMMARTCTVQVNLDYASEADMVKKFRVGLALQPVATALFANSPFTEGKPNGFKSWRAHIWTDTDPDRTGMLPFVFEDGFGFERWVDYILDVPMYFVYRGGRYLDASGQSFRDFMAGRLPALPGETPTMSDWADHMTTAFPEVRVKTFLEMRGADGGPWKSLCGLPAFWVGLLYDGTALDAAWDLAKDWSAEERQALCTDVAKHGFQARFRTGTVQDLALRALDIARAGLSARRALDKAGNDETGFLQVLHDRAAAGKSPADTLLEDFASDWAGDIDRIWTACAY
ncbi:MAG: glutamate--cysteine ligase [Rhodospirillaceae bacterium]|nr:glutamate--cysteine ligase [Rhodospirillaceae bacterium]MYB14021.1 glutamate--cysteine ligase [Rhodospirillaceae bacterium]MYI47825.1 glutamate--cysteine ligase [Rhodospirillaceae bacterium]